MTKKDYELVADVFADKIARHERQISELYDKGKTAEWRIEIAEKVNVEVLAIELATAFESENPKFNRKRFKTYIAEKTDERFKFWDDIYESAERAESQ